MSAMREHPIDPGSPGRRPHLSVLSRILLERIHYAALRMLPDGSPFSLLEAGNVWQLDSGVYAAAILFAGYAEQPAALHVWLDLREPLDPARRDGYREAVSSGAARPLPNSPLDPDTNQPLCYTLLMWLSHRDFFLGEDSAVSIRMDAWRPPPAGMGGSWPKDRHAMGAWYDALLALLDSLAATPLEWELSQGLLQEREVRRALEQARWPAALPPVTVTGSVATPPPRLPAVRSNPPANLAETTLLEWLFNDQFARWATARVAALEAGQACVTLAARINAGFAASLEHFPSEPMKVAAAKGCIVKRLAAGGGTDTEALLAAYAGIGAAEATATEAMHLAQHLCSRLPGGGHQIEKVDGRLRCIRCAAEAPQPSPAAVGAPPSSPLARDGVDNAEAFLLR